MQVFENYIPVKNKANLIIYKESMCRAYCLLTSSLTSGDNGVTAGISTVSNEMFSKEIIRLQSGKLSSANVTRFLMSIFHISDT